MVNHEGAIWLGRHMLTQGLVQVYTQKTRHLNLAHIGLTLRATGQDLRVLIVGCLPHQFVETEDRALSYLGPNVTVKRLPLKRRPPGEGLCEGEKDTIRSILNSAEDTMRAYVREKKTRLGQFLTPQKIQFSVVLMISSSLRK